ncbi:DUF6519 domain-containing protein [Methylopila sp. M107]|uniref:DUF6519 domain-containing protein n=1 Tax=Methylopila sp. M107 TaxID=1101190 RepID=UPI00037FE6B3|nr:DUF6519 domain-containing protein [Methylopila sp. M107]
MKGQISRYSFTEEKHFSGVYQVQGGMVTDADLGETSEIARARVDNLGDDAIRDGVPAVGGAARLDAGAPVLQAGVVYADGVRGVVTVAAGAALDATKPLDLYAKQADFPTAPAFGTGEGVLYADIWSRAVFPLEDGALTDYGLHGAETSFRAKTMAQLRWAPALTGGASTREMIETGTGAYPRKGDAVLTCSLVEAGEAADDCDPCAKEIAVELRVPNALFRVEVVHVVGPANAPESIEIAWSRENAAEQYPVAKTPNGFGDAGVFEFFSAITESHMGVFADPTARKRSAFDGAFPGAPRARDDDGPGTGGWPFVRRWDGHAVVNVATPALGATLGSGFTASVDVAKVTATIVIDILTVSLDLKGKSVLAGDFWLVELREFAPAGGKTKVLNDGLPVGIDHHYAVLFATSGDAPAALPDADRRKLSFPPLSDIPASHVSLDPATCPKLFDGAENVQQALSNLCAIEAGDIAYTDGCPVLYGGATTVQQALDALCKVDFGGNQGYRQMFDWGVVCGLGVASDEAAIQNGVIRIETGSLLDRSGRFQIVDKPLVLDLKDQNQVKWHFTPIDGEQSEFCIAIAVDDAGAVSVHLYRKPDANTDPKENPFGPPDLGFCESVKKCHEEKRFLTPFQDLKIKAADSKLMEKVLLASSAGEALQTSFKVSKTDAAIVDTYVADIDKAYKKVASAQDFAAYTEARKKIDDEFLAVNPVGDVADIRRAQRTVKIIDHIKWITQKSIEKCVCEAIVVPCPPPLGEAPYVVPIGCAEIIFKAETVFVQKVCVACCRKQALTLRAMRYRQGGGHENDLQGFDAMCCDGTEKYGVTFEKLKGFHRPGVFLKVDCLKPGFLPIMPIVVDRPIVTALAVDDAKGVLVGNGAHVIDIVDITAPTAVDDLLSKPGGPPEEKFKRLEQGDAFEPGDKVAILQRGGVAQGFIVLEKGDGRLPFGPIATGPALTDVDFGGVIGRLDEVRAGRDAVTADLDALTAKRNALAEQVSSMRGEVEALTKTHIEITQSLAKSKLELTDFAKQRDELVSSLRSSLPVNAVVGDQTVVGKLAVEGFSTTGDMANLSETVMKDLVKKKVFTSFEEAAAFKSSAAIFITKPRG